MFSGFSDCHGETNSGRFQAALHDPNNGRLKKKTKQTLAAAVAFGRFFEAWWFSGFCFSGVFLAFLKGVCGDDLFLVFLSKS